MPYFLAGLAALALFLVGSRALVGVDPRRLAAFARAMGGTLLLALAAFLALRGLLVIAVPVFLAGASLLGWRTPFGFPFPGGGFPGGARTSGKRSGIRTGLLAMELDHDTGEMDGEVLRGPFAGSRLSELPDASLAALLRDAYANDPDSARLLEAYLDRRQPDWRKAGADKEREEAPVRPGAMSRTEALEILGLEAGATEEEIRRAHRTLMKKLHPDQGGSTYFAARLNEAKDVLLGRRPK